MRGFTVERPPAGQSKNYKNVRFNEVSTLVYLEPGRKARPDKIMFK